MELRTETIEIGQFNEGMFTSILDSELDLLHIKGALETAFLPDLSSILDKDFHHEHKMELPDGCFFPLPYAAVHRDDSISLSDKYFRSASHFSNNFQDIIGKELSENIFSIFEKIGISKEDILTITDESSFSPFNIRLLKSGGKGILIHCENSFLNELETEFRTALFEKVDIENAISFLFIIKKPVLGGELILFNTDWNETKILINECDANDRHIDNLNIFKNKGFNNPKYTSFSPMAGDLIIFRAAQIWHTINSIIGDIDRITLGTFVARDKFQDKLRYWA